MTSRIVRTASTKATYTQTNTHAYSVHHEIQNCRQRCQPPEEPLLLVIVCWCANGNNRVHRRMVFIMYECTCTFGAWHKEPAGMLAGFEREMRGQIYGMDWNIAPHIYWQRFVCCVCLSVFRVAFYDLELRSTGRVGSQRAADLCQMFACDFNKLRHSIALKTYVHAVWPEIIWVRSPVFGNSTANLPSKFPKKAVFVKISWSFMSC